MNENQEQTILRGIAISSSGCLPFMNVSQQDRQEAFRLIQEFQSYDGRMPVCIKWLQEELHLLSFGNENVDITVPVKLFALGIVQTFVKSGYMKLQEGDRLALRSAIIVTARQVAPVSVDDNETRVLANKIAVVLSEVMIRDFPQRWTTFFNDLYVPISNGGLWSNTSGSNDGVCMGIKIALECLKLITEDCTDSDFNSKISTTRRNDVLIGLNEVKDHFLPLLFNLLQEQYGILTNSKSTLHQMHTYLISQERTLNQMKEDERSMYQIEVTKKRQSGKIISESLVTLSRFCYSMPFEWIFGIDCSSSNSGNININTTDKANDFSQAFLHFLCEPTSSIQVRAAECLYQLATRKLGEQQWFQLISSIPQAVINANQIVQADQEKKMIALQVEGRGNNPQTTSSILADQFKFHRELSKMSSLMISAHVSNITNDKKIMSCQGYKYERVASFLRLLADMLQHPSGRICSEQINVWITLLRDPQIASSNLLKPFISDLISSYMTNLVRIRWDDIENRIHPFTDLIEKSWYDEDEYDTWLCDLRSKSSQLFKFASNADPKLASDLIASRMHQLLQIHGNGEPRDNLCPDNNQLTPKSQACMQFEGAIQPLENILLGLPTWTMQKEAPTTTNNASNDRERANIRASVQSSLSQLATTIILWDPPYVYLKHRRASLLEGLRHYWLHDASTLLSGVESLLKYLTAPDEWKSGSTGITSGTINTNFNEHGITGQVVGLRKKSGIALVSIAKKVPQHLVPWLRQLSDATKNLLSSTELLPQNQMHLYEFLSCVATAVGDPVERSNFIADVNSGAINTLESPDFRESISTVERLLTSLGVMQASKNPESVTDPTNVEAITANYVRLFSAFNQLLAVGKRCHEAARKRPNGGIPMKNASQSSVTINIQNFPDEGPVSIRDLAVDDPFVPLWPRILPELLQILDVTLSVWHPEHQAVLLPHPMVKYLYAISDDEAYLSKKHDAHSGGVFGESGTAGSVVKGTDRRACNLVPKWSGWFNELRNASFQLLGLLSAQRVLYAPEISQLFPKLVEIVTNPAHLQSMEHRHLTQYLKQFLEILLLSCPATMYKTHLAPIAEPVFEHLRYRLQKTWEPVMNTNVKPDSLRALSSADCAGIAALAARGGEEWYGSYYARCGLVVGDLDCETAEAVLDKCRIELTRTFSDVLQSALALKGNWALVLANHAKEEGASKRSGASTRFSGPKTRLSDGRQVNADGTPRSENQDAIDARKIVRINSLCHFLFLEDEVVAGSITLTVIQCLGYPDAYTCRRCTKICHRILETVAWSDRYIPLLGDQMFRAAAKNIVLEPKWMVGIEWDMINVLRDICCRLMLGQWLQPGGQGTALQQPRDPTMPSRFEQAKSADQPLQGGGILAVPSEVPRQILASLPGVDVTSVNQFIISMNAKRGAKDQKDVLRDLLRVAAENSHALDSGESGVFARAVSEEALLNQNTRSPAVGDLPEKLVTQSMKDKEERKKNQTHEGQAGLYGADLIFGSA